MFVVSWIVWKICWGMVNIIVIGFLMLIKFGWFIGKWLVIKLLLLIGCVIWLNWSLWIIIFCKVNGVILFVYKFCWVSLNLWKLFLKNLMKMFGVCGWWVILIVICCCLINCIGRLDVKVMFSVCCWMY